MNYPQKFHVKIDLIKFKGDVNHEFYPATISTSAANNFKSVIAASIR